MKKRLAAIALLLPLAATAACSGATTGLALTANWYANTNNPYLTETRETLSYAVTFKASTPSSGPSVSYDAGTYDVLFEDVTNTGNTEGIPSEVPIGFHGYHLHSELKLTGRYSLNGKTGEDFHDGVVSDVWFMGISDALRPVLSIKQVKSTVASPIATEIEDVAVVYDYTYTAVYNEELTETKITFVDHTEQDEALAKEEKTLSLNKNGSFFDNEQLLLVLRAVDTSSAVTLSTVNPVKGIQENLTTGAAPVTESREVSFTMNGEPVRQSIDVVTFSLAYSGSIYTGRPQSYVYAKCTNPDSNTYRNVLLSMQTYALDSLGTFDYTLTSADFTK